MQQCNNEGALVYLELLLGRPLHWFICMLHGCELPFRALVRKLDGGTSGPLSLKGPIGSTLTDELTEEPLAFKEAELLAIKEAPLEVPHYPCHTQAVERAIKLVSEASAAVIGQEAREGFISQQIKERQELNKFESKKDYFQKVEAACKPNDV